jgi:hypothetical protein
MMRYPLSGTEFPDAQLEPDEPQDDPSDYDEGAEKMWRDINEWIEVGNG